MVLKSEFRRSFFFLLESVEEDATTRTFADFSLSFFAFFSALSDDEVSSSSSLSLSSFLFPRSRS